MSSSSSPSSSGDAWSPSQYHLYQDHRKRAPADLFGRFPPLGQAPKLLVDLGCGSGELTLQLAQHPCVKHAATGDNAKHVRVIGVDSSPNMLNEANKKLQEATDIQSKVEFMEADMSTYQPDSPIDILFSSAALHWIPGHSALFPRLFSLVKSGGFFACSMPANFAAPSHTCMFDALKAIGLTDQQSHQLNDSDKWKWLPAKSDPVLNYHAYLSPNASCLDIWETTYIHEVSGPLSTDERPSHPVAEWTKGSAAGVLMKALPQEYHLPFMREYCKLLDLAYPTHVEEVGGEKRLKTLLPFRRIFIIAQKK